MNVCKLCESKNIFLLKLGRFEVWRCEDCEFQYIENSLKYLDHDWFDKYFERRKNDDSSKLNELREKQYLIDCAILRKYLQPGSRVLDVGCSNGKFLHFINSSCFDLDCLGIDIDGSAITSAKENFGETIAFQKSDILSISAADKFDLIIFRGTFQYLGDKIHQCLKQINEILAENGKVIIFSLPSSDSFIYKLLGEKWALFHPEMSLIFNERSVRFLLDKHSFEIEDISYPYLEDVYANMNEDYNNVVNIINGSSERSNPFWGSIMRLVLSKSCV